MWSVTCAWLAMQMCDICESPCGQNHEDCCTPHQPAGCGDADCCKTVCDIDASCCTWTWSNACANLAKLHCPQTCLATCGSPGTGNCCEANGSPFCNDAFCCQSVCDQLPHCCDPSGGWDDSCVSLAASICGSASNCDPKSCKFHCGSSAPAGCWCDELCFIFKDCCLQACEGCPDLAGCHPSVATCVGNCFLPFVGPVGCGCDPLCVECLCGCCDDACWCPGVLGCPSTHAADLNGDGVVGVADLLILLGNWGPCSPTGPCTGDLNADRTVGVPDLLFLLQNWG